MSESAQIEARGQFAKVATEYLALVADRLLDARELLIRVQPHLSRLYAAALELGEVEYPGEDEPAQADERGSSECGSPDTPLKEMTARLGQFDSYRELFDGYGLLNEEPVGGSLADDLTDIASDLADGLAAWNRGAHGHARWAWRFSFESHWGEHATSALRALHVLRFIHQFELSD